MAGKPGEYRSPSGTRSVLFVGQGRSWSKPISTSPGASFLGAYPSNLSGITRWPFVTYDDFDNAYSNGTSSNICILPVNHIRFSLGNDAYIPTNDGVPGTNRVRKHRTEGYAFDIDFPIIVTNDESSMSSGVNAVYSAIIAPFVKNEATSTSFPSVKSIMLATSHQTSNLTKIESYPCLLETFDVNVSGVGNANQISCRMRTRGILKKQLVNRNLQIKHSFPSHAGVDGGQTDASNYTMDSRFSDGYIDGNDPEIYGGRIGTIKDCVIRLGDVWYQQVVDIKLNIKQVLDFVSHSENSERMSNHEKMVNHADAIHLSQRIVTGSFSFLADSVIGGIPSRQSANDLIGMFPFANDKDLANTPIGEAGALTQYQWSSPLFIGFGCRKDNPGTAGLEFEMPATYWQPTTQEVSPSSSLVTVKFMARSSIVGGSEFN